MSKFEMYKSYCQLNGISPSKYESIKQFALDFPEYLKKKTR